MDANQPTGSEKEDASETPPRTGIPKVVPKKRRNQEFEFQRPRAPPPKKKWMQDYRLEGEPPRKISVVQVPRLHPGPLLEPPPLLLHTRPSAITMISSPTSTVVYSTTTAACSTATVISTTPTHVNVITSQRQCETSPSASRRASSGSPTKSSRATIPSSSSPSYSSTSSSPSTSNKQISSPDGKGSPRRGGGTGTREVHNKLEKHRRAQLKECFEDLRKVLPPAPPSEKKISHLTILHGAVRYIQTLRRKERQCEHELERLVRDKIAAQQRIAELKRELSLQWEHLDVNAMLASVAHDFERESASTVTALTDDVLSDSDDNSQYYINPYRPDAHKKQNEQQKKIQESEPQYLMQRIKWPHHSTKAQRSAGTSTSTVTTSSTQSASAPASPPPQPPVNQLTCPPLVQPHGPQQMYCPKSSVAEVQKHGYYLSQIQHPHPTFTSQPLDPKFSETQTSLQQQIPIQPELCHISYAGVSEQQPSNLPHAQMTIPVSSHMISTPGLATVVSPAIQLLPSLHVISNDQPLALTVQQPASSNAPTCRATPQHLTFIFQPTTGVENNKEKLSNEANPSQLHYNTQESRHLAHQNKLVHNGLASRFQAPEINLVSTNNSIHNGRLHDGATVLTQTIPTHLASTGYAHMVTPTLTPIVAAPLAGNQVAHFIATPHLGGKLVAPTPVIKSVNSMPFMNSQYVSATALVKPLVVVSTSSAVTGSHPQH